MVLGKLLFETVKYVTPRARQGYDYLYAVSIGTAIGIGNNPEIRQAYEFYRGKNYQSYDKYRKWDDKVLTKRFKGDVFIDESSNTQRETHSLVPYRPNRYRSSANYQFNGSRKPTFRKSRKRSARRCTCQGNIRRAMVAKPKQSRRKYRYSFQKYRW